MTRLLLDVLAFCGIVLALGITLFVLFAIVAAALESYKGK